MFWIVPDSLTDKINATIDAAIADCPDAEKDRAHLYWQLLNYYNEHGLIPDFTLAKRGR